MRRKTFNTAALQHIYQRTRDRGVLFYSKKDRLVYYTLGAVNAKRYGIRVCAASIMFTHIHQSIYSDNIENLRKYLNSLNASFSRLYNHYHGRKGVTFDENPGRSQKIKDKDKRSNLIYVYNNHVEKGLCSKAMDERWSFLAYAFSDNPFSNPITDRRFCRKKGILQREKDGDRKTCDVKEQRVSDRFAKVLRLVNRRIRKGKALEYVDLDRILPTLDNVETEQFIDYVISRYEWIDFDIAASHFLSKPAMVAAIDSTTGGEYDINEDYDAFKDAAYIQLSDKYSAKTVFSMTEREKLTVINRFLRKTDIPSFLLKKFFHYSDSLETK